MKKIIIATSMLISLASMNVFAQQNQSNNQSEFKVITIVESIVPGGIGRSRIIESTGNIDINSVTTVRDGSKSNADKVDRDEVKAAGTNLKETKLVNFYSFVGINFENIASNDATITAKINEMLKLGWQVAYITSGVESDAGKGDGAGIFITRIFFKK